MEDLFYKKLLVISDNSAQCGRLRAVLFRYVRDLGLSVNWACSPFSNADRFRDTVGITFATLDLRKEADVETIVRDHDLVLSMHCKQLFPERLVSAVKCINVHPGYNPVNRGWYPQVFAIIHHTLIGATIHEMDKELDHGNIIDRQEVPQFPQDTSREVYNRVLDAEINLLERNLKKILGNRYETVTPEAQGRLYLKKDFRAICELDPDEVGRLGDFIDRLRALTHAPFRNAYYIERNTGQKIFVNIELDPEIKQINNE
jgi:methionyl-tRNA formyltransferase